MGFGNGSGISWTTCKQSAPHSRQITMPIPHHFIYRLDALPDAQPTVSKHWRQYRMHSIAVVISSPAEGHWRTGSIQLADQGQRGCGQLNQTSSLQWILVCSLAGDEPKTTVCGDSSWRQPRSSQGTLMMMMMMYIVEGGQMSISWPLPPWTSPSRAVELNVTRLRES